LKGKRYIEGLRSGARPCRITPEREKEGKDRKLQKIREKGKADTEGWKGGRRKDVEKQGGKKKSDLEHQKNTQLNSKEEHSRNQHSATA